jgi:hypothetical protein
MIIEIAFILTILAFVTLSIGAVRAARSREYRREVEFLREQRNLRKAARRKICGKCW